MVIMLELGKKTDGIVSRYINRRISTRISRFVVKKFGDVSPNKITLFSFMFGLFAAAIYLFNMPIVAGIMVQVASIIDGMDGEIARALKKESRFGAFLDSLTDRIVDVAILMCFSIFIWRIYGKTYSHDLLLLLIVLALSGSILVSYSRTRCEATIGIDPRSLGGGIASRDIRLFIIFVGSVVGLYIETLILIALLTHLDVSISLVRIYRNASTSAIKSGEMRPIAVASGAEILESRPLQHSQVGAGRG